MEMKYLKILHISGICPDGGVKTFLFNYQRYMPETIGFDYLYFTNQKISNKFDLYAKSLGSEVYKLPSIGYGNVFTVYKYLDDFFKNHAKDYVAVHNHSPNTAFLCFTLAEKYGIKYRIIHSHNTKYADSFWRAFRNKILCFRLNKQANIFLACSKSAGEFLYNKKNMDKVHIIKNSIECEKFKYDSDIREQKRNELNLKGKFVVGHVGRFEPQKNHMFLLDVFRIILQKNINARLILVGEGSELGKVKSRIKELNLESYIKILGVREDVNKLYQTMDVFVLPSIFEGLGMVLIEAQAIGLPCVISDTIPKEAKIVDELITQCSLNDKFETWADKILTANFKPQDRSELLKLAGYDINLEKENLIKFYFSLIGNGNDLQYKKINKEK